MIAKFIPGWALCFASGVVAVSGHPIIGALLFSAGLAFPFVFGDKE